MRVAQRAPTAMARGEPEVTLIGPASSPAGP
jgi:hypothetical protein